MGALMTFHEVVNQVSGNIFSPVSRHPSIALYFVRFSGDEKGFTP